MYLVHQPEPVLRWKGEEARRELNDIKADVLAFLEVSVHHSRHVGVREEVLHETACRDVDIMAVR